MATMICEFFVFWCGAVMLFIALLSLAALIFGRRQEKRDQRAKERAERMMRDHQLRDRSEYYINYIQKRD